MFAEAVRNDDGDFEVPVPRAVELRDVLARPWPSGMWTWAWTPDAAVALERAESIRASIDNMLTDDNEPDLEVLQDELLGAGFTRLLLPAQLKAVAHLTAAGGGGNFSVPGSGKTTMTYAIFALLRRAQRVDRMLVIAPQSAYEAWTTEAIDCFQDGWSPQVVVAPRAVERRADVLVLNYERASTGAMRAAIDTWGHGHKFLVVFDEAHRAKRGARGLHGRGALDISSFAEARLALTGTPMPNGPDDLIAILDLAWPGQGRRLASPLTPNNDRAWVRITKEDLDLEPAIVEVEAVALDPGHQRIYDALMTDLYDGDGVLANHGELTNRAVMRMIAGASNPALLGKAAGQDPELKWPEDLPDPADLKGLLDDLASAGRPAKLIAAARHADQHRRAGKKLLVWTNFVGNVEELTRLLALHNPAVITGRTALSDPAAPTDRERELRKFREDASCSVLIATPQTLGEGVSLHKVCQSQLHIDRTFNAGLYLQSLDRTHRVGMPEGTHAHVTVLVARGTIDERIDTALRDKLTAMDQVLNDPTLGRLARVKVDDHTIGLAPSEVTALLRHLREGS
jgi:SNF2 family DNA or RNA helicase